MIGQVEKDEFWQMRNPIAWATSASIVFATIIIVFALAPTCNQELFPNGDCPPKWKHIYVARPNEVGDTLAGLAGVFAFIWLIGTVLLQSMELREQRKEFREQRIATQDMARAMAAQAAIFESEKASRDQEAAKELIDQLILKLRSDLISARLYWAAVGEGDGGIPSLSINPFGGTRSPETLGDVAFFRAFIRSFETSLSKIRRMISERTMHSMPHKLTLIPIVEGISRVITIENDLSPAQRVRIETLSLMILDSEIRRYLTSEIWAHSNEETQ